MYAQGARGGKNWDRHEGRRLASSAGGLEQGFEVVGGVGS
jgi:hypothetical protein